MNVLIFGATGMVGQGVLRECLLDSGVERVLAVGRRRPGGSRPSSASWWCRTWRTSPASRPSSPGFDACFFCLGVSSFGMAEERYRQLTYDLTLAVARTVVAASPRLTFVYVSGAGTDSSEQGRSMWARVKGRTENDLRRLPFKAAYMFRPGAIVPLHGVRSKTRWVQIMYTLASPLVPAWRALFPNTITTTEQVGLAMLRVVRDGYPSPILETRDINACR